MKTLPRAAEKAALMRKRLLAILTPKWLPHISCMLRQVPQGLNLPEVLKALSKGEDCQSADEMQNT